LLQTRCGSFRALPPTPVDGVTWSSAGTLSIKGKSDAKGKPASRRYRVRSGSDIWEQMKAGYAAGINLREIARKMNIPEAQSVYVEAVRDFLKACGVADPKVQITRVLRVDLDGDGEEEVPTSATNYFTENKSDHSGAPFPEAPIDSPRPGSYSIIILRRVVDGNVQTKLVAGEVSAKPDESVAPNVYNLAAVLDLNGDGKLEVIVHSFYYEGGQTTIYRCEPDKIEALLSVDCGA
jgi:hypothetical protein